MLYWVPRFSLDTNEAMDVHVTFKPEEGQPSYEASFLLIDEEQHATSYELWGRAKLFRVRRRGVGWGGFGLSR